MLRAPVALVIAALALPTAAQERLTETIEVRVVNIDAVVTGRDGNRVTGLTAADFEVVDDGQTQQITNFLEIRGGEPVGAGDPGTAAPAPASRRFVFFVDGYSIHPSNRDLYVRALRDFVEKQLQPGDLASIVSWNTELFILAPLTSDRGVLRAAIDKVARAGSGAGARTDLSRVQRACTQSVDRAMNGSILFIHAYEECINIAKGETMVTALSSRRLLNAMELAMTTIAGAEGKKYFVLAGARLPRSPGIEIYQWVNQLFIPHLRGFDAPIRRPDQDDEQLEFLERVARVANAHGVTLYTIAATISSDLLGTHYESAVDDLGADQANQANTFDAFEKLSSLTGGFSVHRPSDFGQALESIARESESYYSLGYRPRQPGSGDRPITIRMKSRDYTVRARRSHALKTADDLMTDKVVANIFRPVAAGAWRPVVATAAVARDGKTFKVPFEVTIPPRLTLLPAGNELAGGYTVYVAVGTQQGAISTVFRQPQPLRIAAAEEKAFRKQPLLFGATLTVRPGESILSIGVVDHVSGEQAFTRTTIAAR
ncbi:MAG TPA: VWA domain-containing protein [Thermoanaerobaculia bacterium]|nr:VWA domain-containing protein [Thermoanaerobaculia bacterium]